jgi:hypothetical protein
MVLESHACDCVPQKLGNLESRGGADRPDGTCPVKDPMAPRSDPVGQNSDRRGGSFGPLVLPEERCTAVLRKILKKILGPFPNRAQIPEQCVPSRGANLESGPAEPEPDTDGTEGERGAGVGQDGTLQDTA